MRFLKGLGLFLCSLASVRSPAGDNKLGIHEVSHVKFDSVVHVGNAVLPAGEYIVGTPWKGKNMSWSSRTSTRKILQGEMHAGSAGQEGGHDEELYQLNAGNERVLQELVFRGDTAKHVF